MLSNVSDTSLTDPPNITQIASGQSVSNIVTDYILDRVFDFWGLIHQRCTLLFTGVISHVTTAQDYECPASTCPDAWITFRGSCYYISDNVSVDWTEATHHCKAHHAELITIQSVEEDTFIRSLLERYYRTPSQHPGQEFWIGANDMMIEGIWEWYTDNSSLEYTGWYPGQPGSEGDEDCAVIASRSDVFNGWHDAPCAALHHPVCEIR